ncbi:hypothetical protein [Brachybacterium kimchii]|uniref:Holin n=1 Tax=Brachybacterium kimchii TaxID=2942909 RepID=A0ABY4N7V7_9MICO|nr:hypothetical protein [Brachybacterium kimchii]UQN30643.1 hypothetical protein M4486_04900 [Brachybacterium kimchii]
MSDTTITPPAQVGVSEKEPVLTAGAIIALIEAILMGLTAFGIAVTPDQHAAIVGIAGAILAILGAVLPSLHTRGKVTANPNVVEHVQDGAVLAGEASELPTGDQIRQAGDLYDGYTDPLAEDAPAELDEDPDDVLTAAEAAEVDDTVREHTHRAGDDG